MLFSENSHTVERLFYEDGTNFLLTNIVVHVQKLTTAKELLNYNNEYIVVCTTLNVHMSEDEAIMVEVHVTQCASQR